MRTPDAQLYRAFRFVDVQATSAYPLEALDDARAMRRLRGRQSEACAARFFRGRLGSRVVRVGQEPIRAVSAGGDGVGMVRM